MTVAKEMDDLATKVANIYRAYASTNIWISTSAQVEFTTRLFDDGSGLLRIGEGVSLSVGSIDDVNRLRQAVNELALAMMKYEPKDV